jgi:hypothetical protein
MNTELRVTMKVKYNKFSRCHIFILFYIASYIYSDMTQIIYSFYCTYKIIHFFRHDMDHKFILLHITSYIYSDMTRINMEILIATPYGKMLQLTIKQWSLRYMNTPNWRNYSLLTKFLKHLKYTYRRNQKIFGYSCLISPSQLSNSPMWVSPALQAEQHWWVRIIKQRVK